MTWAADWRVYLHLPAAHIPSNIRDQLSDALALEAIGAVELPLEGLTSQQAAEMVERVRPIIQPADVPLIAHGTADRKILNQLNGIRLDDPAEIGGVRRAFPAGFLVGATLEPSRDDAMRAGELDPDFVYLPSDSDMVRWWSDLMIIPGVAPGGDLLANAIDIARLGPDFVALNDSAWNHPDGPAGAIKSLAGLLSA